jgi:hypothetical protein
VTKRTSRWPIWKIATATGVCVVVSAVLAWRAAVSGGPGRAQAVDPYAPTSLMTPSSFLMILASLTGILGLLGLGWLAWRIREARRPAWERRGRKKRS